MIQKKPTTEPSPRRVAGCALIIAVVLLSGSVSSAAAQSVPSHPSKLEFQPLVFDVPKAEQYRHVLDNGVVAYVVEDHALPLVDIGIQVRIGSFLEPATKVGLASMTGTMLRRGGTEDLEPGQFDESADQVAANLSANTGSTSGGANMNCLSAVLEDCLDLFFEMLQKPRFDQGRIALEKDNLLERLKQRNDNPAALARREWQWLMYGNEHFASRRVTGGSLAAISRQDMIDFHANYWRPENMIVRVSGDVETKKILGLLGEHFSAWPTGNAKEVPWPPPKPHHVPTPGIYSVQKDIPQGRVRIGHTSIERDGWDDPRTAPLAVMNDVLGGGGFTSRLTSRIRSDEGLAYSAGSNYGIGTHWAGNFGVFFQSKSETVAYAAKIALEEIERIQNEPVSDEELATSKASFIDTFPQNFDSAATVAALFAGDEYLGRPHSYWYNYRDRISRVTKEDVQKAAKEYLDPEKIVFLVVGDWEGVEKGDADGKASMADFFGGAVTALPERDPVSLEPVQ